MHKARRFVLPLVVLAVVVFTAGLLLTPGATAQEPGEGAVAGKAARAARAAGVHLTIAQEDGTLRPQYARGLANLPVDRNTESLAPLEPTALAEPEAYSVGDTRRFLVLDNVRGRYIVEDYEVRLISNTIEIWVQKDLRYRALDQTINPIHPDANDGAHITQARLVQLATMMQTVGIPVNVEYFGQYSARGGTRALLPAQLGLPADYYVGPSRRVIMLIMNVRDNNYYDPVNNPSRIAGFVSPAFNIFADRNIITIDSANFDYQQGAPDYVYEATLAHEFKHLVSRDQDIDGDLWEEEGLAEFAEFLTGYRPTADSHRAEWSDFPENSLTLWRDQDEDPDQTFETLADYQQAYWFFLYLAGRMKEAGIHVANNQFLKDVTSVTSGPPPSSHAIDEMLRAAGAPFNFRQIWRDFRVAMLFGGTSDETTWGRYITEFRPPSGVPLAPLDIGRLRRNLNFEGYDQPGVLPDSTDFIEIGWSPTITPATTLQFTGNTEPAATQWRVVTASSTGITPGAGVSGNVLYSDHTDETDNFLIFRVTVPVSGNQALSFDTLYNIEVGYDYGFVQVTTDTVGARGFRSLPIAGTTSSIAPDNSFPIIRANLPGFNGVSGSTSSPAWVKKTHSLAAYAGQEILLAFRYATDGSFGGEISGPPAAGWYLDNIKVGDTALYTNEDTVPAGARSIWEVRGLGNSYLLQVVTFAENYGHAIARVIDATLDATATGSFNLGDLLSEPGFNGASERVVALVSAIAPQENDIVGRPPKPGVYRLTGLPASIYTSRARAIGSTTDSSIRRPKVYPGDTFSVTVTVDNLGRAPDLEAAPGPAYVAVPIPANTQFEPGSLRSNLAPENMVYTENLQSVDTGLPAAPGVYWHGIVTRTADLSFALRAAPGLAVDLPITPTAHFANGMFKTNPAQRFTDLYTPVKVSSPLALSTATGTPAIRLGQTAVYSYTLVNTDDQPRDVDFRFNVPEGTALARVTVNDRPLDTKAAAPGELIERRVTVPSYLSTRLVTVVTIELNVTLAYRGRQLNPMARVLQPGTEVPYVSLTLGIPNGATTVAGSRLYLPHVKVGGR